MPSRNSRPLSPARSLALLLLLPCLLLAALPSTLPAAGAPEGPKPVLPRAIFSGTTIEVKLPPFDHPLPAAPAPMLVVDRPGEPSRPIRSFAFDSTGTARVEITAAGSHRFTVRLGSEEYSRQVRALPGFITILPPLVAILFALLFRQVLPALFIGIWFGTSLLAGLNPWTGLLRLIDTYFVQAMTDRDHVRIIIFSMTLGGMVGLIAARRSHRTGGGLSRLAVSRRMGQFSTWLLGLLIFFDDYSNTLMVGNTMRPFSDRLRISREKLSYIVDTPAPRYQCRADLHLDRVRAGIARTSIATWGSRVNAYWLFLRLCLQFLFLGRVMFALMVS